LEEEVLSLLEEKLQLAKQAWEFQIMEELELGAHA